MRKLKIVIFGDIHGNRDLLQKLLEEQSCGGLIDADPRDPSVIEKILTQKLPDLALITGDFLPGTAKEEDVQPNRQAAMAMLSLAEQFNRKCVYVPGNHDVLKDMYVIRPVVPLSASALNAHGACIRVADNLVVIGIGGSGPAFLQNKERAPWSYYPFESEFEVAAFMEEHFPFLYKKHDPKAPVTPLGAAKPSLRGTMFDPENSCKPHPPLPDLHHDFSELEALEERFPTVKTVFRYIHSSEVTPKDNIILLSHMGPSLSTTTLDTTKDEFIESGSFRLNDVLFDAYRNSLERREQFPRVCCAVHGHTHNGVGVGRIGDIPVINPGALQHGNYGVLTLAQEEMTGNWRMAKYEMMTL